MGDWVVLHVFTMQAPERLSAPGAFRDIGTLAWMAGVILTGGGSWWLLMRLVGMSSLMHRRSVATFLLFATFAIAVAISLVAAAVLDPMLPRR